MQSGDIKRNATEMRLHAAVLKGDTQSQNNVGRQARASVPLFLEITRYFLYAIF